VNAISAVASKKKVAKQRASEAVKALVWMGAPTNSGWMGSNLRGIDALVNF